MCDLSHVCPFIAVYMLKTFLSMRLYSPNIFDKILLKFLYTWYCTLNQIKHIFQNYLFEIRINLSFLILCSLSFETCLPLKILMQTYQACCQKETTVTLTHFLIPFANLSWWFFMNQKWIKYFKSLMTIFFRACIIVII